MRTAFKEWAVIVDALGHGGQILILRKGGISEGRGGFAVEHPRFLLFPTLFHQQRESVIPSAQTRFDAIASGFPPADQVRIEYFCDVVAWRNLECIHRPGNVAMGRMAGFVALLFRVCTRVRARRREWSGMGRLAVRRFRHVGCGRRLRGLFPFSKHMPRQFPYQSPDHGTAVNPFRSFLPPGGES